jgi:putative membrane protein
MNKLSYNNIALFLLIVLHSVGIVGLNLDETRTAFETISHINISISLLLVLLADHIKSLKLIFFLALSFTLGMLIEIVGVKTGIIFGAYHYTDRFGPSIMSVPVAIGLNWFLLTLCVMNSLNLKNNALRAILGGACMTAIDFILEPFATKHNFWVWESSGIPPIQNYLSWFIFSTLLCYIFILLKLKTANKVARYYLLILLIFLLIDNFIGEFLNHSIH